ncbi:MAG: N-acetyltransferase [Mycobacteriales bacterium]
MLTRPATEADLESVTSLCQAYDLAEFGVTDFDLDDVREMLALPGSRNQVTVADESRALVGFLHLDPEGVAETVVDPAGPEAEGVQRLLLTWALDEARRAGLPSLIHVSGPRPDGVASLLSTMGFRHERSSWRMHIPSHAEVSPPRWPTGVGLRPFDRDGDARAVWSFVQDNFAGTFGSRRRTFQEWSQRFLGAGSDVTCAVQGEQLAGVAVLAEHADHGFVAQLAVDGALRGRGIGLALVLSVIARYAASGRATRLNVDGTNEGALGLYRTAGMEVDAEFREWVRALD